MKIIRWKYFGPLAVFLALLIVFFVVFFDPLCARVLQSVASKVNGAKVEVSGFKTKFFQGRVQIARLQVTDRKDPMRNIVETGVLSFQLNPSEVLKKRFVINDASIHGLQFDTPRKTSGALPKAARQQDKEEAPGPAEKLFDKYKDRFKVQLGDMKTDLKGRIQFDPKNTHIVQQSEQLKAKADALPKEWDSRIQTLNAQARLKQISDELDAVKKTPTSGAQALTAVPDSLKKLKDARDQLQKLKSDTQATKDSILGDAKTYRAGIASLQDAKKQDADDILSRLNLDFANPDKLMEGIVGPLVLQRFQTIVKYVQIAREHMPTKKETAAPPVQKRSKGIDVTFPTPGVPPRFWLVKAGLDGVYQNIAAMGSMTNLASDPSLIGKPFVVQLNGASGAQRYALQATLDHVTDVAKDSFSVKATGLDVASAFGSDALSALSGGDAAADVTFNVVGEGSLTGVINVAMTHVKLDKAKFASLVGLSAGGSSTEDSLKTSFANNVIQSIEAMPQISVQGLLSGTWSDPSIKLSSNLTGALSQAIKTSFGNAIKDQRAQLDAKLNDVMNQQKAQLDAKGAELEKNVNDRLGGLESEIDKKIKDASGINLPSSGGLPIKIPSLNKFFK